MESIDQVIARERACTTAQVRAVRALFEEGGTVPFIARYRKERTGGLDETALREILKRERELQELEERREAILRSLKERELLTPELDAAIRSAPDRTTLEDRYLPYRPRKTTRADNARERGLGPLADALGTEWNRPLATVIAAYRPEEVSPDDALAGACDIVAEEVALDEEVRARLRELFVRQGALESSRITVSGRETKKRRSTRDDGGAVHDADTYRDYFSWREPARRAPSHRVLAILRGAGEKHLRVQLRPPEEAALRVVQTALPTPEAPEWRALYTRIATDAWKRLLLPSLEREAIGALRQRAENDAVTIFQRNLEALLLAPPFGPRRVLAIDPGIRTGAKYACITPEGVVTDVGQIFPLSSAGRREEAAAIVTDLCRRRGVAAIAVGDGTGGRETEQFLRNLGLTGDGGLDGRTVGGGEGIENGDRGTVRGDGSVGDGDRGTVPGADPAPTPIPVVSVHESGASVYSASPLAGEELPGLDVQYRGAVSIGRRLQDPLAELVKIDPAAIGVGQYQHEIDHKHLADALDATVESCVNRVGVDINTASVPLLRRVAGLSVATARKIVSYREKNGLYGTRAEIGDAPGIGPKTVEQAVGFLRCPRSENPLENTAVHPERYELVERIAADAGVTPAQLVGNEDAVAGVDLHRYIDPESGIGEPTLKDILHEISRPGRDPRERFVPPAFDDAIRELDDLREGIVLSGVVRNVTAFGAFVDIGIHRDGLVHVSELADRFVSDPAEVVRPGQNVTVLVTEIDRERSRIGLSMKRVGNGGPPGEG